MTPALSSSRLALAPYHAGNVEPRHLAWLNDPEVVRYSEQRHQRHTLESQHAYLNSFDRLDRHIWLISRTMEYLDPSAIGTITAYIDRPNGIADIGILIGERGLWNDGYGTEAWATVMRWLFEEQRVRKVEAGVMACNRGMRAVAKHSGMTVEGIRTAHFMLDGELFDLLLYGRLKP